MWLPLLSSDAADDPSPGWYMLQFHPSLLLCALVLSVA